MKTINLDHNIYKEFHILTKSEFDNMPYTGRSLDDSNIKTAFLSNHGTILFFENMHFLVIPDNAQLKTFAIWCNHKIIGYCDITQKVADKANNATNAVFYFGFDPITAPEKY